ncbi:MAG: hypothetical protein WDK96_01020 [Candidatus Paceibacterota bacterium]|jgi:hypothetical protein
MNKNKGFAPILIVLVVVALLVVGGVMYFSGKNSDKLAQDKDNVLNTDNNLDNKDQGGIQTLSNCGFTINSPVPNSTISSNVPVVFNGVVDNTNYQTTGCRWTMFEGEAGTAQLYYQNGNNWGPIGIINLIPVSNWMTLGPVPFTASVIFNNGGIGLQSGTLMKVVFTENDPSGATPDTLEFPLVLQ